MDLVVLIATAAVIVLLLVVYFKLSAQSSSGGDEFALPPEDSVMRAGKQSPCPLCGAMLKPGERVRSVVYPGKGDRLVEIYGCPYCYPPNGSYPRLCPSCKRVIEPKELIFARLFDTGGKIHVHVNGCRVCMRRSG